MTPASRPRRILGASLPNAFVCDQEILIVFKAYFDGSGDEGTRWITLAGVGANDEMWAHIERRWNEVLLDREPQAEYLHMKEVGFLRNHFDRNKGWTEGKVNKLIWDAVEFLQTLDKERFRVFFCSVDTEAHSRLRAE